MPQLDFKEISQGNIADGQQDSFELFAREFMERLGYKIQIAETMEEEILLFRKKE